MQETREMQVWSLGCEDSHGGRNGNSLQYSCLEFHGQRGLAGNSPWGQKDLDISEQLSTNKFFGKGWKGKIISQTELSVNMWESDYFPGPKNTHLDISARKMFVRLYKFCIFFCINAFH